MVTQNTSTRHIHSIEELTFLTIYNAMTYTIYVDDTRKNKMGLFQVYVFFKQEGKSFRVGTGLYSSVKFSGREFPKTEKGAKAKTNALGKILIGVDEYIASHRSEPFTALKTALQAIVSGKESKAQTKVFVDYVDEFRATKTNESTRTMYRITADKVREFDASSTFDTITKDWLTKFENYFTKKKGMSVNGLAIHIRNIRTVFNWAIDNEWTEKYPFRRFKVKSEKVAIRNLTAEQIATLRDYKVEPWQEIYRDLFMLSFYLCGMNAADLLQVKKLTNGRMVYHRQKTGHLFNLPVPPEAEAIIDKYRGINQLLSPLDDYKDYRDFTHHWNDALKKIGTVELTKDKVGKLRKRVYRPLFPDITTYCARYSFASIAAELDIPRETIALCLGHSWADVTSHYVAYDTKKIDKAVRQVIDYANSVKSL